MVKRSGSGFCKKDHVGFIRPKEDRSTYNDEKGREEKEDCGKCLEKGANGANPGCGHKPKKARRRKPGRSLVEFQ